MSQDGPPPEILGRLVPAPEGAAAASSVDVLVVDGDATFRGIAAGLLRRNAHTVVETSSAAEAAEAIGAGCRPRLILVGLDGASGSERTAFAALREDPSCAHAGLLLLSRGGEDDGADLRPSARILKPVEATELVEAVRRLCGTLGAP
ncbi:MAG: hypothetical protein WCK73_02370 [Deltaproteobacteria bacterium]